MGRDASPGRSGTREGREGAGPEEGSRQGEEEGENDGQSDAMKLRYYGEIPNWRRSVVDSDGSCFWLVLIRCQAFPGHIISLLNAIIISLLNAIVWGGGGFI